MPIFISGSPDVFSTMVAGADNMVTANGDQMISEASLTAPPIEISPVSIGTSAIAKVYVGSDLIYEFDNSVELPSGENINLQTFLDASAIDQTQPCIVNLLDGSVIGGTIADGYALDFGDLSAYVGITFNVSGSVDGFVGSPAMNITEPVDIINRGDIKGAIICADTTGTAKILMIVSSTGAIRAGGGNGGSGGNGGAGDDANPKDSAKYQNNYYEWWYGTTAGTVKPSLWNGATLFTNNTTGGGQTIQYRKSGSYWYWSALFQGGATYGIQRGLAVSGVKGLGGKGGLGAGYGQARTDGALSSGTPTYRSGAGGKGGNGGDWGVDGAIGEKGASGLYYTSGSSTAVRYGADGLIGTSAGNAIVCSGLLRICNEVADV